MSDRRALERKSLGARRMTQNTGHGAIIEQVKTPEDDYPPSASPDDFVTRSEEKDIEEGNAFLRVLLGGAPDLGNLERLPPTSVEMVQQSEEEVSLSLPQFSFRRYDCKLPNLIRARVTGKIGRKLYMVRDVEILTYLYEHITRPSARLSTILLQSPDQKVPCLARVVRQFSDDKQRRSNPRLYRGVASNFDCDNTSCTVYLVDYGEQVDCSSFLVYDLSTQTSPVLETQAAAFKFQLNGVLLDGECCSVDFELRDNCNYDLRLTGKDGEVFLGFVCMQSEAGTGPSIRVSQFSKYDDGDRKLKELKELEKKKAELDEKTKNLRTERQLFELQASERQQELMLMMIQLQCAQVSQKIDMIASNALYRSSLGACWNPAAPMFPLMMPPYGHYPVGMPMINQLMQSVENSSMSQLQNIPFNTSSSFPTYDRSCSLGFTNPQYPFIDGLIREPVPSDTVNDTVNINGRSSNSVDQQQVTPENIVSRRKQVSDVCGAQSSSSLYRGNVYKSHVGASRKTHGRLAAEDYSKLNGRNNVFSNKLTTPYLESKRENNCGPRESRKPEYGEPPRFLMETSPSKKQAGALQSRTDAFSYGTRGSERSNGAFNENGKVLEFRNSGRTQRGTSSPRALGKAFRQITKRTAHVEEEHNIEISGIVKPDITDVVNLFGPEPGDGVNRLPSGEKQSKDTNSSSARRRGSLDLDEECVPAIIFSSGHLIKPLRYVEYIPHMDVEEGKEYVVKRSDDDRTNSEWPLFFVQIQDDKILDFIVEHLDSLHSDDILPEDEVIVGQLCLSYCHAFQAMFRAVITAVMETDVEVHYIDYGNYENVTRSELRTISDQSEITRTHKAMAVPCIIKSLDEIDINTAGDLLEEDIAAIKEAVACDDERSFTLRFLRKRPDGVRVVELVNSSLAL